MMKASEFQFTRPYVTAVTYEENKGFTVSGGQVEMPVSFKPTVQRDDEIPGQATVHLQVKVGTKTDKTPFCLSLTMAAHFKWEKDAFSEEMVESLLNKNAVSLLIGYCRPIIATLTSQSRFPAYNIPFIDLTSHDQP